MVVAIYESRRPLPQFLSVATGARKTRSLKKSEINRLDGEDSRYCAKIELSGCFARFLATVTECEPPESRESLTFFRHRFATKKGPPVIQPAGL
jgi:hypothetical protein